MMSYKTPNQRFSQGACPRPVQANPVDGEKVLSHHFGTFLDWDKRHTMKCPLEADGPDFVITSATRFADEVGEQATMSFGDPSGNALESKTLLDKLMRFAH